MSTAGGGWPGKGTLLVLLPAVSVSSLLVCGSSYSLHFRPARWRAVAITLVPDNALSNARGLYSGVCRTCVFVHVFDANSSAIATAIALVISWG